MVGYIKTRQEKNIIKKILNKIEIEEYENGNKYTIPKFNKKLLEKLKEDNIKNIVVAKKDKENIEFLNNIYSNNMNIIDGKILFKHLIPEIIEYISNVCKINKNDMQITILANDYSQINIFYINELITEVKSVNIVTNNINRFKQFADRLYNKEAIVVPIMNNKNKSLLNKKIILNIDFSEEQLKKYKMNRKAIIINIENNIEKVNRTFTGININNYKLISKKEESEFEENEIDESYIIMNKIQDIRKIIIKENLQIKSFIGNRGEIDISEYEINTKSKI
ncbi:MAG TPA: hypothetical protein OIM48_03040 [Clostridiaceae bacterium]|jgi:hypothetical protein|nr:hypothetical protein [Clostridium sp.]HJJ12266.1 hypothetical protein [Clostridiaceae bacterium]